MILSEIHHSHHSLHLLHSPDPNPLITDHHHLSALINSTIYLHSSHSLTVWSQLYYVVKPDPLTGCYLPVPAFPPCSPPLQISTVSTLHCSLWIPWNTQKDNQIQISLIWLSHSPPAGYSNRLCFHCCCLINLLYIYIYIYITYLCVLCLSADRRPDLKTTGDGAPESRLCRSPWRAGQRFSSSSLSGHTPSICQSHGHPCQLFGWGGRM